VLNLTKHYDTKTFGGADVQIRVFLTSALVGGARSVSSPGHFTLAHVIIRAGGGTSMATALVHWTFE
jgi:hypothetical protein